MNRTVSRLKWWVLGALSALVLSVSVVPVASPGLPIALTDRFYEAFLDASGPALRIVGVSETAGALPTALNDRWYGAFSECGGLPCLRVVLQGGTVNSGQLLLPDGLVGTPPLAFTSETQLGLARLVANYISVTQGGVRRIDLGTAIIRIFGAGAQLQLGDGQDVILIRAAADTLALQRSTNAQKFILGSGTASGRLDFGVSGAVAPNPAANVATLYVDESTNRVGGAGVDCVLVARKSDGTEVSVATLVTDGGCP